MATSPNPDWKSAVEVFADRFNGRYMAQVMAMRNHVDVPIREWSGFAIIAIDCLVIETLGQFYRGLAAEYRTKLPDEATLAAELERTRKRLEARIVPKPDPRKA